MIYPGCCTGLAAIVWYRRVALLQLENLHRGVPTALKLEHLVCWSSLHASVAEVKVEGGTNSLQWQLEVRLKHLDFRSGQCVQASGHNSSMLAVFLFTGG